ncbi:MAG: histidine kinase dimerization/phospho-acceptor domain-containing protein [Gemmatimonadota bacterium]
MPLSRFRLHLTFWFGAAFIIGLLVLDAGFYLYSRQKAEGRINRDLAGTARGLLQAIQAEAPGHHGDPAAAVEDAISEWPAGPGALVVWGTDGRVLGGRGPAGLQGSLPPDALVPAGISLRVVPIAGEADARVAVYRDTAADAPIVAAIMSTAATHEEDEVLLGWLLVSLPLVALLALAAGYVLARRALDPVRELSARAAAIDLHALHQRLPVRQPADEIDGLADQFNQMLARLERAQAINRTFLARAAHQLKTPLTVVQGESALGLERPRDVEEHQAILRRIRLSAEQMSRRVAELVLLARATAGDRPPLDDQLELDGLAWQSADLMRARAQATRHQLELGTVEHCPMMGNEDLLREACLELLENGCRHSPAGSPIRLGVSVDGSEARLTVASLGGVVTLPSAADDSALAAGGRLGLAIVQWIALVHGGRLTVRHEDGANTFTIHLPISRARPEAAT